MDAEEELLRFMVSMVRSTLRIACVGIIYFSVFLALDTGPLKAAVSGGTACVLVAVGLGRLVVERLAIWALVLLIVDWVGLLPLKEWGHAVIVIVSRALN